MAKHKVAPNNTLSFGGKVFKAGEDVELSAEEHKAIVEGSNPGVLVAPVAPKVEAPPAAPKVEKHGK